MKARCWFWPNHHHPPRRLPDCAGPGPGSQLTPPQWTSNYPNQNPPAIRLRKPSPNGSVFSFWPQTTHPRAPVSPHLPAPQPWLTQPQIGPSTHLKSTPRFVRKNRAPAARFHFLAQTTPPSHAGQSPPPSPSTPAYPAPNKSPLPH